MWRRQRPGFSACRVAGCIYSLLVRQICWTFFCWDSFIPSKFWSYPCQTTHRHPFENTEMVSPSVASPSYATKWSLFRSPRVQQCRAQNQNWCSVSRKGGGRERVDGKHPESVRTLRGPIASPKKLKSKFGCKLFGEMDTASLLRERQVDAIHYAGGRLHLHMKNLIRWV